MNATIINQRERAGVPFWACLLTAPLIPWAAYLGGWGSPMEWVGMLSLATFLAILLHDNEGRIPFTEVRIAPRLVIGFWCVLGFGIPGGILVAAGAAFAGSSASRGRRGRWLGAVAEIGAILAAGAAFGAVLGAFRSPGRPPLASNPIIPSDVLAAAAVMLAAYQIAWLVLNSPLLLARRSPEGSRRSGDLRFVPLLLGHLIAAAAATALLAAFGHFGTGFGLVLGPICIVAHIAHRIHLRRLDQKTREIADASRLHLATVEALATAIDARDQVGLGHVRRTQIFAIGVGTALGLGDDELNALRAAALLHDIGKLAVPEHILNKPGRLTPAELEKAKVHSTVGASILETVGFPYPVVPTVRHHHECWDGSGYPDGLTGDRIPITARILSVADAYDALRGPRPFRAAVSREDACNFLRSRAGSQFDPHVVNVFLRNLRELEAEIEIHGIDYGAEIRQQGGSASPEASYVEQIKRANQEVFSLYEIARDFGAALRLDETLGLLARKIKKFVPYDTCLIYLLDDDHTTATAAHVEGKNREVLLNKRVTVGEGATGYVLKKRRPVENVDPSLDFAFSHADICDHYIGMACVPLLADEKLIGAISLFSGKLGVYGEEHLRLLETISRIAADAISKSIRHAESESHAQTDPLTGLANARGLHAQFEKEVGRARRSNSQMQMLMLDLDGFKAVNDMFGHKAGDTMLREVGRIIKSELRDYDFLARYGGDEFVALVPETDSADVIELCARIEAAVGGYAASFDGAIATVGVSVGAAGFPAQGETFEELLTSADRAMYRAKAFHKQRLVKMVEEKAAGAREPEHTQAVGVYVVNGPPDPEQTEIAYDIESDFIVELDESHIVVVNTVN